jgi:ATP-dependent RNA helicase RhlE
MLQDLFVDKDFKKVILFTETKRLADRLCKKLNQNGIKSGQIHGNKSQNFRNKVLDEFKNESIRVLVATDVAARGIDVQDVTHVINYQLPMTMDSYIHRIGRTGRAGKTGRAITFIN